MKLLKDVVHVAGVLAFIGLLSSLVALAGYLFTTAPAVLP